MTKVHNILTGQTVFYSLPPLVAVVYAQAQHNGNEPLDVIKGQYSFRCGNWTALF